MTVQSADDIYEAVKRLPVEQRLRLMERIAHDLAQPPAAGRSSWMEVEGIAPDLLAGEDAQAWVSRTRREADESRESALRSKP
jgi:hypothetical protein